MLEFVWNAQYLCMHSLCANAQFMCSRSIFWENVAFIGFSLWENAQFLCNRSIFWENVAFLDSIDKSVNVSEEYTAICYVCFVQ